jgi:hypothetical protein
MCSGMRTLNNKARKYTQAKFYKTTAVPIVTYGFEIRTQKEKKEIVTTEIKLLRSVAG